MQWMQRFIDGLDQRAEVLVGHSPLVLVVAAAVEAVGHRLVLQVAFAALVADRAIERMVDEQEFHHAVARLLHHAACWCVITMLSSGDRHGAGARSAWAAFSISTRHMRQLPAIDSRSW